MSKKTFIKDEAYYAEAEDMQEGWGETLRYIDTLKDNIQNNVEINLSDYLYSLYGNGYCSHCWKHFERYVKVELNYSDKCMLYQCWEGLFKPWNNNVYNSSENLV
jgi:hypothetical protein